ncbi:filamentous hemagglutinin N-terminal domain-containing protein [Xanthomonas massiliensis]|uniref:two-partner secretion domain-containing protein n=1 Tax=Xanthomonas massiliensis TaxID=1720302 RepID=UPI0008253605|nr:filamentous hemagglutinin N-terminal domain-containing protein [Xanthomonas massiliensis]
MNFIYRLVFNRALGVLQTVSELATRSTGGGGVRASAHPLALSLLSLCVGWSLTAPARAATTLPALTSMNGVDSVISSSNGTMTVKQTAAKAVLNWDSFNVGSDAKVVFNQPGTSSVALNLVNASNGISTISGKLTANGNIFLINTAGILFDTGSTVNVGGLVASSRTLVAQPTSDDGVGTYSFVPTGAATGSVVNKGTITVRDGGGVALLGTTVTNKGTITADGGNVSLLSGGQINVSMDASGALTGTVVDTMGGAISLTNDGTITAHGGSISMQANGGLAITDGMINNHGLLDASGVTTSGGSVTLTATGASITGGTIDVSGAGAGGQATLTATGGVSIDDINASGTGSGGSVTITTTDSPITVSGRIAATGAADSTGGITLVSAYGIDIDAPITTTGLLTLQATKGSLINANADVSSGAFLLNQGYWWQNSSSLPAFSTGDFEIAGGSFLRVLGGDGSTASPWQVADIYGLQGMAGQWMSSNFTLANDIDASSTATWNDGLGFDPIGSSQSGFAGTFDGAGHTITGLTIDRFTYNIGLFGTIESTASVGNLTLANVDITGSQSTGALAGFSAGTIDNVQVSGTVSGQNQTGGLVGSIFGQNVTTTDASGTVTTLATGNVSNSSSTADVTGGQYTGGLVGINIGGNLSHVSASGNVAGYQNLGGLVGLNQGSNFTTTTYDPGTGAVTQVADTHQGNITDAQASGDVSSIDGVLASRVGGLVGANTDGNLDSVSASGHVTSTSDLTGGLIGYSEGRGRVTTKKYNTSSGALTDMTVEASGIISHATATGDVSSSAYSVGGLVGYFNGGFITDSHASGAVAGNKSVGGLVGEGHGNASYGATTQTTIYAPTGVTTQTVTQDTSYDIANSDASGNVTAWGTADASQGQAANGENAGGLVGDAGYLVITGSHASGDVSGGTAVGGLVGHLYGASYTHNYASTGSTFYAAALVDASYATGTVTANGHNGQSVAGGLVGGMDSGNITASYATGAVTALKDTTEQDDYIAAAGGLVGMVVGENTTTTYSGTSTIQTTAGGSITGSYATGTATATGDTTDGHTLVLAGGLVADLGPSTTLSGSFATGAVSSAGIAGGLVGYGLSQPDTTTTNNSSTDSSSGATVIKDSYASGAVSGGLTAGGLVGYNGAQIVDSYATGAVSAAASGVTVGGLVGINGDSSGTGLPSAFVVSDAPSVVLGSITASFYATSDASGAAINSGLDTVGSGNGTVDSFSGGKSWDGLTTLSTFTDAGWDIDATGGTSATWRLYAGNTSPLLRSFLTAVTLDTSATSDSKTYDGSVATTTGSYTAGTDVDTSLVLGNVSYTTTSKNAGTYSVADGTLLSSGSLYSTQLGYDIIEQGGSDATLTITPKDLTGLIIAADKTYDGSTGATTSGTLDGLIEGDQVSLATSGSFADKNAGTGKTVNVTGTLSGADAGNYVLDANATTLATIDPKALTITAADASKTQGQTAQLDDYSVDGLVDGDAVTSVSLDSDGTPAGAAAGSYTITASNAAGDGLGNYVIAYVGGTLTVIPSQAGGGGDTGGGTGGGFPGGDLPSGTLPWASSALAASRSPVLDPSGQSTGGGTQGGPGQAPASRSDGSSIQISAGGIHLPPNQCNPDHGHPCLTMR